MVKTRYLILPLLIALVILPRLSVDLYLPALPNMTKSLHVSDALLQMTLTVFMFGYALSMLVSGPLSDVIGRKRVMFLGLCLYLIATLICAITSSITILISARFFQALGGCCGTVVARVMVRDAYSREEQIHLLAYLSAAMAICPLLAPIVGGSLQIYFGWRIAFYVLAIFALILLIVSENQFIDTHKIIKKVSFCNLIDNYKVLLQHRTFIGYSLAIGFAWCNYFAFTLESPFLLEKTLGLSMLSFGLIFSFIVLGYLIGTVITKRFANQVGWDQLILIATYLCIAGAILMTLMISLLPLSWPTIASPMIIIMIGVGIIIPCTQGAVMQPFPTIAGTASGLFFFIQMTFGGICGLIIQNLKRNSPVPMALVILISSVFLLVSFYWLIWRRHKKLTEKIA